jgi:putative peptidoglycan lipid II flippase
MLNEFALRPLIGTLRSGLRDIRLVVASTFGLSGDLDVLVAVMGFHLLFGVQVGNALDTVVVSKMAPVHGRYLAPFLKQATVALLLINVLVLSILVAVSRPVLGLIFPAFTPDQYETGVRLIRMLLLPIAFAGLAGLMRGGLSVSGIFVPGFLAGSVVSLATIVSVLLFANRFGIDALVWGFAIGHFLVLIWFAATLVKAGPGAAKTEDGEIPVCLGDMWRPVLIVLAGEVLYQAIVMTERSFASGLGTGKISAFFYAGSVIAVPLALLTMPVRTTLFPRLARAFHDGCHEGRALLTRYGTILFGVTLVACVLLSWLSEPLIELALARGKFSTADARLTAHILSMLVWVLPFASVYGVIRNSFYSLSDYRTPMLGYGVKWAALLLCGSWLIPTYGVDGLAGASVAAQIADTGVMVWMLQRRLTSLAAGGSSL